MERSEVRIAFLMRKLNDQAKIREDRRLEVVKMELDLKLKLAEMFKDDIEGFMRALNLSFVTESVLVPTKDAEPIVLKHSTTPISRL
jgi:hypothetical protein